MGVLEAAARIIELGGSPTAARRVRAAEIRATFEKRTGAFLPEDAWFEERSRAFWCDAVTRGRFGREVEAELSPEDQGWLASLERAHRGLFRRGVRPSSQAGRDEVLVDVWSGAEIVVSILEDASRAELEAAAGQLLDARVVGRDGPLEIALLPGAIFHPRHATAAVEEVVDAARARALSTHETLDALLRMERSLRALSRVKANYAYRAEALSPPAAHPAHPAVRRTPKGPR